MSFVQHEMKIPSEHVSHCYKKEKKQDLAVQVESVLHERKDIFPKLVLKDISVLNYHKGTVFNR